MDSFLVFFLCANYNAWFKVKLRILIATRILKNERKSIQTVAKELFFSITDPNTQLSFSSNCMHQTLL